MLDGWGLLQVAEDHVGNPHLTQRLRYEGYAEAFRREAHDGLLELRLKADGRFEAARATEPDDRLAQCRRNIGRRRDQAFVDEVVSLNAFPLAFVALGQEALAATLVATIITICILFAVAIVLIEIGLQTENRRRDLVMKVGGSLIRNPLLVAPVLGAFIPLAGLDIAAPAETFLKLLGGAASPCALVALGLFLAAERAATDRDPASAALLVGFKLILQPTVTWILATVVSGLSPMLTHGAVLLAALPTGTGPFMLAELYGREAAITSNVVLTSTILSVMTISGYLAFVA